ncbi:uncharacterized protein LOC131688808 [Topomyia yanbarensis]|uniref:uncharacterized protein LOC131688808 n=1 Tax=Topomyia yanbarensis TaxID=2498891 RepID=UPI00273CB707|nr:uncharacterized protein LOC131688808 [Topomyia yanbarensis]
MNPLVIENFERLVELQPQTRFMTVYFNHMSQEITPARYAPTYVNILDIPESTLFFDTSMQAEIRGIPDYLRSREIPKIFTSKYQHIDCLKMFYTDSLSTIAALRSKRIDNHDPFFLGKIRESLSNLTRKCYKFTLVWLPAHCSIAGNEKANNLAKIGALDGEIYERPIAYNEFYSASRQRTLASWQTSWDNGDMGRWLHSIIPKVSTKAWFKGLDVSRDFIRVMSRLMSNHYTLDAHLRRIGLAEGNHCACGEGYHDIEHVVWSCTEYREARSQLVDSLQVRGRSIHVPVRDILAYRDPLYMELIYHFLKTASVKI